jgi:hypothetical protein
MLVRANFQKLHLVTLGNLKAHFLQNFSNPLVDNSPETQVIPQHRHIVSLLWMYSLIHRSPRASGGESDPER